MYRIVYINRPITPEEKESIAHVLVMEKQRKVECHEQRYMHIPHTDRIIWPKDNQNSYTEVLPFTVQLVPEQW